LMGSSLGERAHILFKNECSRYDLTAIYCFAILSDRYGHNDIVRKTLYKIS
jgi:hypothetical protein